MEVTVEPLRIASLETNVIYRVNITLNASQITQLMLLGIVLQHMQAVIQIQSVVTLALPVIATFSAHNHSFLAENVLIQMDFNF